MTDKLKNSKKTVKVSGGKQQKTVKERLEPYQFKKGQSGNPNGRPKGESITSVLRRFLEDTDENTGKKNKEMITYAIINQAKKGNPKIIKEILDRTEGKVKQNIGLGGLDGEAIVIKWDDGNESDN